MRAVIDGCVSSSASAARLKEWVLATWAKASTWPKSKGKPRELLIVPIAGMNRIRVAQMVAKVDEREKMVKEEEGQWRSVRARKPVPTSWVLNQSALMSM